MFSAMSVIICFFETLEPFLVFLKFSGSSSHSIKASVSLVVHTKCAVEICNMIAGYHFFPCVISVNLSETLMMSFPDENLFLPRYTNSYTLIPTIHYNHYGGIFKYPT